MDNIALICFGLALILAIAESKLALILLILGWVLLIVEDQRVRRRRKGKRQ